MIKHIIIYFLLACLTIQACDLGCMKCDSSNQCIVCDSRNNFFLSNGSCLQVSVLNCLILAQNGACLQCNKNYYLDINTKTCVTLKATELIANCRYYNPDKACVRCEAGFYISGISCAATTAEFPNCDFYSADSSCLKCKSGYVFDTARTACVSTPQISNCAGFNSVQCTRCANGYFQNPNLYFNSFYGNNTNNNIVLSISEIISSGNLADWTSTPICQKVADENCVVPDSLTTCKTCKSGYFVNANKICELILDSLPNCSSKQTVNNDCISCADGYYLNSNIRCSPRVVTTCLNYSPSSDTCTTCDITKYLTPEKFCQSRSTKNCLTFNLNSDTCLTCHNNIRFLNSANICIDRVITNCLTFAINSDTCLSCYVEQHFLSSGLCNTRTVTNCLTFNPTNDNCLSCVVNTFYLNNNLCLTRTITTCLTYNPTSNTCLTCIENQYWKNASNICITRTVLTCLTYNISADQCVTCPATRYINVSFNCILRTQPQCATTVINADQCATCISGYYLNNGACPQNTASNCLSKSTTANLCDSCITTAYRNPADSLCKLYTVANCDGYSATSDACIQCLDNYYMSGNNCLANNSINCLTKSKTSNTCTTCVANTYRDAGNNCQLYTVSNCNNWSPNSNACVDCNDGFYLNVNDCPVNTSTNCAVKSKVSNTCTTCLTTYYAQTSSICTLINIANCKVHHTSLNQCLTCNDFYYVNASNTCSPNPDAVLHCVVYTSATTCGKCADLYLLASSTSCVPITEDQKILNCATYRNDISTIQCTRCVNGYYVNNNVCSPRVFSNNILNCSAVNLLADQCLTCAANYRLTDDKLKCLGVIPNCNVYDSSNSSTAALTCASCVDGYYVDTGALGCSAGNAAMNCLAFATYNSCLSCQPTYYLFGVQCRAHTAAVTSCSTLSTTALNECGTCNLGYHPFKIFYGCVLATAVPNCSTYNSAATCTACNSGFYLNGSNKCASLPANCVAASNTGVCSQCANGYFLDATNPCFSMFNYITQSCDTINSNQQYLSPVETSDVCQVCSAGTIRQFIGGANMCVQTTLLTQLGITVVANCKRYNNSSPSSCIECNTGYHLSDMKAANPTCDLHTTFCTASQVLLLDNLNDKILGCITPTTPMNCRVAVRIQATGEDPDRFACLQVAANYLPVMTAFSLDINTVFYEYSSTNNYSTFATYPTSFFYQGYIVDPINVPASNNKHTGACELYFETLGYYVCYRATFGNAVTYTGSGSGAASTVAAVSAGCNTSVVYTGFQSYLTAVLSCHSCSTAANKPFVYIQLNGSSSSYWSGIRVGVPSVTCEYPSSAVANCAIYGQLFDSAGVSTSVCLSCMPGFKPSSVSANKSVASCVAITDCDLTIPSVNTVANRCAKCSNTNASGNFLAFGSSDLTSCVPTSYANCFIAATTLNASGVYDCARCKAGFFLNVDKKCESLILTSKGCADSSSTIFGSVTSSNLNEYYLVKAKAQNNLNGCYSCTSGGDSIVQVNANEKQCISSTYVSGNSYVTSTVYIPNCSKYSNYYSSSSNPSFKCSVCLPGYTVTANSLNCVTVIANCAVADSIINTRCVTCSTNFINVNGACQSPAISNCATYANTSNGNAQLCSQCNTGYGLMSNGASCSAGSVTNCNTYTNGSTTDCTACVSGYGLVTLANNAKMCVDIQTATNCVDADNVSLNYSGLYCNRCSTSGPAPYAVTKIDNFASFPAIPLGYCLPHPMLKTNCASYDGNSSTMSANTFNCLTCNAGTLFVRSSDNTCASRTTRTNCSTYTSGVDTCATCNANYWLSPDGTACTAYPPSILNCRAYSLTSNTCSACEPNFYLSGNTCVAVTNIVANCLNYSNATTCSVCQPTYFLDVANNVCIKIIAENCKNYANYNQCSECYSDKKLKPGVGGRIDCVVVNLQFCLTQTGSWPYCSTCFTNYFFDPITQFCVAPAPISNCVNYSSLTACSQCTQPYFVDPSFTCSIPNITGCSTYSSYSVCTACNTVNYFPSANGSSCVLANSVANCQTYSSPTTCQACPTNYWLESNACNIQQLIIDCLVYASSTTCSSCAPGKYPVGTFCSVPTTVPNCSFYDSPTTCQTCLTGYFLSGNKLTCTLITVVNNCLTYSSPTVCSACQSGYMLTSNSCPLIWNIPNCVHWSAFNTCDQCQSGTMLNNGYCPTIVNIPNCSQWSAYDTCSQCQAGYMLNGNTCPQIVSIQNCLHWSAYNTCDQCASGSMLYNGICPLIVQIEGCIEWSAYNTCKTCSVGRYLYQNRCTRGEVSNCLSHDALFTCVQCQPGYVLSLDRLACLPTYFKFVDSNCENNILISNPTCTVCSPGYYFDANGSCTSCTINNTNLGCLVCDPNNREGCFMCQTGYYQNSNGTCVAYQLSNFNPNLSPNTNGAGTNTTNTTTNINTTNITNSTNSTNSTGNGTDNPANQNNNSTIKSTRIISSITLISIALFLWNLFA